MRIEGHWFSAESSTRHEAGLLVSGGQYRLMLGELMQAQGELAELSFSDRVGDITRKVYWPDGAMFESRDNRGIDLVLQQSGHRDGKQQIWHRLERSGRFALLGVLITALAVFAFFKWGVPVASRYIAWKLPQPVLDSVSDSTFATLEKVAFERSELPPLQQERIRARFAQLSDSLPDQGVDYRLYFRAMSGVPNALALPAGQVVVTDALIEMVEHDEELDSVLLHEIAHVVHRHGLQSVLRASALSVIVALAIGDVSGSAELITGLPVFLLQSSYSREFETEADSFAFEQMVRHGMDPVFFSSIMYKLSGLDERASEAGSEQRDSTGKMLEYLSTHPDAKARADRARQYSGTHFHKQQ